MYELKYFKDENFHKFLFMLIIFKYRKIIVKKYLFLENSFIKFNYSGVSILFFKYLLLFIISYFYQFLFLWFSKNSYILEGNKENNQYNISTDQLKYNLFFNFKNCFSEL